MSEFEKVKDWKHTYYGEPIVILSLDEAKNIYNLIAFLKNTLPIDAIFERCVIEELEERIKTAEQSK